ncbi:MAG: transposase [Bryobacterales bacterium]|nr:transposase [Bryobacterales bacterium]
MATPPSHSQSVLPEPRKLVLRKIEGEADRFVLYVRVEQVARCPGCQTASRSVHSAYRRTLADLPWQGLRVEIRIQARKFRCRNASCRQKVFAERLDRVAAIYARRTDRLGNVIRLVGYSTGGLPGSRLLERLAIRVSDDTLLRTIKSPSTVEVTEEAIHHLGVDDWAWKKGQNYGTILVDLERHRVIDLLPDRSAKSLEQWLSHRTTIRTVNRDRAGAYAEGASKGAPDAVQIADRFHLFVNFSDAVERALESKRQELEVPLDGEIPVPAENNVQCSKPETAVQRTKSARRCRRLERYQQVIELHASGHSQKAIANTLGISRKTVRCWMRSNEFPERKPVSGKYSHVREFEKYLHQRWAQGCHNATQLFREIRARGYRGSRQMVSYHVSPWRKTNSIGKPKPPKRLAPKDAAILICKRPERRSADQQNILDRLTSSHADIAHLCGLALEFRNAMQNQDGTCMLAWIDNAASSDHISIARFAQGLRRDLKPVIAAVESPLSSGQVEGQVNRLKALKRQMYGRAGFSLLRARVLPLSPQGP